MSQQIVRILKDSSIPIPKKLREKYKLSKNTLVTIQDDGDRIIIEGINRQEISKQIIKLLKTGLRGVKVEDIKKEREEERCF